MNRPVVITSIGVICAHGAGATACADGFREGRRALRPVTAFDAGRMRVQQGGEAPLPDRLPASALSARQEAGLDRASRLLLSAGLEAWNGSGLEVSAQTEVPMVLGTSAAGMELGERFYRGLAAGDASRADLRRWSRQYVPAAQVAWLQRALRLRGPVRVIANACASGANAVATAAAMIRQRRAELVLAGGYDALCELVWAGFESLQALSTTGSRPFAADRDGLALGEGAAVLVLESAGRAAARGARPLAEVAGWGQATDLHHLTQPQPEGAAARITMAAAAAMAGVTPGQVGYVNAHGTGTPKNDGAEATAISAWAGEAVRGLAVSSIKGQIGHTLGAAGAIETVACVLALQGGWLPPNVAVATPDPACAFELVQRPVGRRIEAALNNSFGFGGANCSLLLKRAESFGGEVRR